MKVSALFIDADGVYPQLLGQEVCWDILRDARTYPGPFPVVAHPPCNLWVNFAALNYARYGGEHNKPGNDCGCFASALKSVRVWGGVLEHPAFTNAWSTYGLMRPKSGGWQHVGDGPGWRKHYVCEVWQSAYGHKARKRTWLYYVGAKQPSEGRWSRNPGTYQCGWFDRNRPTLGKREASATPKAFAEWLISLAQEARPESLGIPQEIPAT